MNKKANKRRISVTNEFLKIIQMETKLISKLYIVEENLNNWNIFV